MSKTWFKKGQTVGSNNHNWKDGKRTVKGYIYILKPTHPKATKAGYIKRSHFIMEQILGRHIIPPEIVHHKGIKYPISSFKNRSDDRPENLQLCANKKKHYKLHPRKHNVLGQYFSE